MYSDELTLKCSQEKVCVRGYLAKILGPDPKYRYQRVFCESDLLSKDGEYLLFYEITEIGIYEASIKAVDKSGNIVDRKRKYIAYFGGEGYEMEPQNFYHCFESYCPAGYRMVETLISLSRFRGRYVEEDS